VIELTNVSKSIDGVPGGEIHLISIGYFTFPQLALTHLDVQVPSTFIV
jgi:hypothetical protein